MTDGGSNIDIIKLMLRKGHEKLETARLNFNNERYDDTVSRAYYEVYHTISAVLMSMGLHFSSHKETIGAFNKEFIKPGTFPGYFFRIIQKLFLERHTSDYDFVGHIDPEIAREDLDMVMEMLDACELYLAKLYNVPQDYWTS